MAEKVKDSYRTLLVQVEALYTGVLTPVVGYRCIFRYFSNIYWNSSIAVAIYLTLHSPTSAILSDV